METKAGGGYTGEVGERTEMENERWEGPRVYYLEQHPLCILSLLTWLKVSSLRQF